VSRLDDSREVLCTLAVPLPLPLVAELGQAIEDAAHKAGYRDVVLLTDGTNRVVATRPARRATRPAPRPRTRKATP
jgi:hypothetical protein